MTKRGMSEGELFDREDPAPALVSLKEQLASALHREKELKAQIGDDQKLFEYLKGGIAALAPCRHVPIAKPKLSHGPLHAVTFWADGHSEELVREEETEGLATYNWQVFEDRMQLLPEKVVELTNIMRQASEVKHLTIAMLGDWFMGEIHPDEIGWGSSMTLPCALPACARVLASAVMRAAAHFDTVEVIGMVGNHGRNTRKPVTKMTADRNWDYAAYLVAQQFCINQTNVHWTLPKSLIHVTDVEGWQVALTHGDVCKQTHTHPYFGISQAMAKEHQARHRTNRDFDYAYMGHWHHHGVLEDSITICPSIIGADQFSLQRLHKKSSPRQLLTFWNQKYGPVSNWLVNL